MKERRVGQGKCTRPHVMDDLLVEKGHKDVLVECEKKKAQKVPLNTFCMFRSVSFLITGI